VIDVQLVLELLHGVPCLNLRSTPHVLTPLIDHLVNQHDNAPSRSYSLHDCLKKLEATPRPMTHLFKSHSQSINSGLNLKQRPLPKGLVEHMALDAFYLKMAWPRIEQALDSMDAADRTAIMNASIKRAEVCDET